MGEFVNILKDVPTILTVGGVVLLILAVVGRVEKKDKEGGTIIASPQQKAAGITGSILVILGVILYLVPKPSTTPTTPTPTPEGIIEGVVGIVHVEYDPETTPEMDGEYVLLRNTTDTAQELTGWTIRDNHGHAFDLPAFVLRPQASVRIWSGTGQNTESDLYWGSGCAIWNNEGDTVTLEDERGQTVATFTFIP